MIPQRKVHEKLKTYLAVFTGKLFLTFLFKIYNVAQCIVEATLNGENYCVECILHNNFQFMQVHTKVVILKQEEKTFEYNGKKNEVVILTVFQQYGTDNAAYSVVAPKGTKFPPYTEVELIADVKPGIFGKNPVLKFTAENIKIVK